MKLSGGCRAPIAPAEKIDAILDDGNLSNGDLRNGTGTVDDVGWILVWDVY